MHHQKTSLKILFYRKAPGRSRECFLSSLTIILCMLCLSLAMRSLPVGITYAYFSGVCIVGTTIVGAVKFSQVPNYQTLVGLLLIVFGVLIVSLFSGSDLPKE